jgi:DNA-binding GntR family transcriptional regulator
MPDLPDWVIAAAITLLRAEGLLVRRHGHATRVRPLHDKQPIDMTGVRRIVTSQRRSR